MAKYDFDKLIDRHGTGSEKFDFMERNGKPADTLPLWVADMDFRVAEPIIDAIRKACDHGIFGYTSPMDGYYEAASGWFSKRFGWTPEKDWLVTTPGVVFAFNMAVQAFTQPGDAVIIQPPVYYPFFNAINANGRKLIESPLKLTDTQCCANGPEECCENKSAECCSNGPEECCENKSAECCSNGPEECCENKSAESCANQSQECCENKQASAKNPYSPQYEMDLEDFEKKIVDNDVKLFIMCSPHNPVGRVWTRDELRAVADICIKHNVYIVADEIHCDFTWEDNKHTMFLDACPEAKDIAISCTAPSKTFNLAGLQASNIWIPNEKLRKSFSETLSRTGFFALNQMGIIACEAAYSQGEEWCEECKEYIYANYEFMKNFIAERLPMLKVMPLQGTYLAWVDFSALGMNADEVDDLICNKAKLWLDAGKIFGQGGENYQRFVLACPRATLEETLIRLEKAIKE